MKNFFVTGLSPEQKAKLTQANAAFVDFMLDSVPGIIIDEHNIDKAAVALNVQERQEQPSTYDGIVKLTLSFAQAAQTQTAAQAQKRTLDPQHEQFRQRYIDACASRVDELLVQSREAIVSQRKEIEALQAELVLHLRAARIEKQKAAGVRLCDREEFGREFDALMAVPKVRDVQVEPGVISVFTETLYCVDPRSNRRHEIGAFQIKIYTDGQADSVRWFNLTRRVDACRNGQQAPHVWNSGRASLNEIREVFPDLIANMKFSVVAQLAIEFIEQVNVEQPEGDQIVKWPVA